MWHISINLSRLQYEANRTDYQTFPFKKHFHDFRYEKGNQNLPITYQRINIPLGVRKHYGSPSGDKEGLNGE